MRTYWTHIDTPLGPLLAVAGDRGLHELAFTSSGPDDGVEDPGALAPVARAVHAYFAGEPVAFDLALDPRGTSFQQRVWSVLRRIPWGETWTYGQVADAIGRPTAARAVGGAIGRNPIAIVVPCHRVVGADGSLTGYASGLDRKQRLLALEGVA